MRHYVTDAEVASFKSTAPPILRVAIDLALLTHQSLDCLLTLSWQEIDTNRRKIAFLTGIRVKKKTLIPVTKELEDVLVTCRRMPPLIPRLYLLRLDDGMPISKEEFGIIWRVHMKRWAARDEKRKAFSIEDVRLKALADKETEHTSSRRRGH